jgi:hypothetical protein
VERYAGNPLALQVVGETIGAVFGGDLRTFLAQDVAVFGGIRHLLDQQVARLSVHERAVLCWLAEAPEPVGFVALVSDLSPVVGRAAVVEAVEALARRSLLAAGGGGTFTLQPVVLEYAATVLVERTGATGVGGSADGVGGGPRVARTRGSGRSAAAGRIPRGGRLPAQGKAKGTRQPLHPLGTATLKEDRLMASFTRQLDRLNLGQTRSFAQHTATSQHQLPYLLHRADERQPIDGPIARRAGG